MAQKLKVMEVLEKIDFQKKNTNVRLQVDQPGGGAGGDRADIRAVPVHADHRPGLRHRQPPQPARQDLPRTHHRVPQNIQPQSSSEIDKISWKGEKIHFICTNFNCKCLLDSPII